MLDPWKVIRAVGADVYLVQAADGRTAKVTGQFIWVHNGRNNHGTRNGDVVSLPTSVWYSTDA